MQLIIFDLDGTLIDSEDLFVESILATLFRIGTSIDYSVEDIRPLFGKPLLSIAKFLNVSLDEQSVVELYGEEFATRKHKLRLFPGVTETLSRLSKEECKLVIASNRNSDISKEILSEFNISKYFSHIFGSEVYESKPSSDMLEAAMRLTFSSPKDTVFIGDSEQDYLASKNCGVQFIRFSNSHSKAPSFAPFKKSGILKTFSNWEEIQLYCSQRLGNKKLEREN